MKYPVQAPDDGGAGGASGAGAGAGAGAGSGAAGSAGAAAGGAGAPGGAGAGAAGAVAGAGAGGATGAGGAAAGAADAGGAQSASAAGAGDAAAGGAGAAGASPSWDADHWRGTWAGADDKKKAWAERRTDLKVALDSAYAADSKIAELSAAVKAVLPKDATPEQLAAYRKDNGIPEKPEGYFETLPPEVLKTLSAGDKSILTPYLSALQELNIAPAAAAKLIALRQAEQARYEETRSEADSQLRVKTEDALRADWGNNYRAEINNINGLLNGAPAQVREALFNARSPDGTPFVGTPEAVRWLAQLARTVNPYSIPVGGDGGALDQKGVEERLVEITRWMGAPAGSPDYKRYFGDEKVQTEYRTLVEAREKMKQRAA